MSDFFSHGLHQGYTTESSFTLWGRYGKEVKKTLVVRLFEAGSHVDFREVQVRAAEDFTFAVVFTDLRENQEYQVLASDAEEESLKFVFKTSSSKGDLHFVFGSCRYNHWDNIFQNDGTEGDETYKEILKLHQKTPIDQLFLLGDQIYADPTLMVGVSESFSDYVSTYHESFGYEYFDTLLSKVPTSMLLDDHEIRNNWSQDLLYESSFLENREEMYKNGTKAYESWQHSRNPRTKEGQYWYSQEHKGIPFFFLDTRTRRWLNPGKGLRKTTLGDEQLSALLAWLESTKGKAVRFIASGIPFCPDTIEAEDKWDAFDEERSLILEFLRLEKIGKTIFLSGDVHLGVFSKMHCVEDESLEVLNLTSSPLFWPYPGMKPADFDIEKKLKYNQWQDSGRRIQSEFTYEYTAENWLRENQFCEVKVKASGEGTARHFNMKTRKFESPWYF
jgi:alkaline phosphatase D